MEKHTSFRDYLTNLFLANKLMSILFFFSTGFYLYQHSGGFSWDFAAYALNAKYLVGGYYFEWFRPPLVPFVLFLLSFAGWVAAEYLYILLASVLHLYSSARLAGAFKVDRTAYYVFSMTVFIMAHAFSVGTELFSLALLQLGLACLNEKKSGIFLGLAALSRYTNIFYLPLLAFQKNPKKIALALSLFLLAFSPWMAYNAAAKGDALAGIKDNYAINVQFIDKAFWNAFNPMDVIYVLNFTLPLFLLGAYYRRKPDTNDKIMLAVFVLTLLFFINTPRKEARFLFNLIIPAAYFSAIALTKIKLPAILPAFAILSSALLLAIPTALENPAFYAMLAKGECAVQSNVWVPLNYYGLTTEPFPYVEEINDSIAKGYRIILVKGVPDPAYANDETFLAGFPQIENNAAYVTLGDETKCKKPEKVDKTFLERTLSVIDKYGKRSTNSIQIKADSSIKV